MSSLGRTWEVSSTAREASSAGGAMAARLGFAASAGLRRARSGRERWVGRDSRDRVGRDGNSSLGCGYPTGFAPDGRGYEWTFSPAGATRTRPTELRVRAGSIFHPRCPVGPEKLKHEAQYDF